ncbi:hypothetical protein EB796_007537 [Bugula neritina]|uniref:CUB domain-containing protein n=1 Tax=Bugula neritina TaxID=10212 RepID=A0A7J7K8A2_BUGNE|nr:hypothetical protein EB796_007537 [Bugula neritina]
MNVTIRILDLENSTSCRHDSLRIGSSLTLCGTKSPYSTLISVSTKFLVIFRSDSLIQKKGFAVTISDATPSPSTTVKTTSTMPSTPTIITEKTTPSVTMPTKKSIQTASTRSPKATDLTSTNKARTLSTVTEKSSQTKQESSTLHTKPTDKAEDISGKSKVRTTKTTPAYVWAIVAVLTISIGGIVAAVVIIQRRKRKSLLQYDNVNDDGDEVDLGFDNPTYGDEMQDL